jgi:hypothetical protein
VKIKHIISQFLILIGFILFKGCSCKPANSLPKIREEYIPSEFKDFAYFKNGSKWIYKDSINNLYDTVEVYGSYIRVDTLYDNAKNLCYFETFGYFEKHSQNNEILNNYYDYGPARVSY